MVPHRRVPLLKLPLSIGRIDDAEILLVDGNAVKISIDMDFL